MRAFISLKLSNEAVEEIKRVQKELKESGLFQGKLTEEENLHLTLKFLGEVGEEKVSDIRKRLGGVRLSTFSVKLGEIGVFPSNFVKIIWIKLEGNGVFDLQKKVDNALVGLFEKEFRFMGHLTVARVKKVDDKRKFFELLARIKVKEIEFQVKSFGLMESELFPEGPVYEIIEEFFLS